MLRYDFSGDYICCTVEEKSIREGEEEDEYYAEDGSGFVTP